MKTALIAGATGLVGRELIKELIESDVYQKIIVLSRRELTISDPKLQVKIVHFDFLDEVVFSENIDECFCTLGTTQKKSGQEGLLKVDYEYVLKLAHLCITYNIPKFLVVSSQGANSNSSFFYMQTKGQMEEAIKKAGIQTIYLVRPSLILGDRNEFRFAEKAGSYIYKLFTPLMTGKLKKLRPVSALQIARCLVDLAQNNEPGALTIESDYIQSY